MEEEEEGFCRMTDHSNLYNRALTIVKRKGFEIFLYPIETDNAELGGYIASSGNRTFRADDPLRLLGMIGIWEEQGDDWYHAPRFPSEKIQGQLMDEAYPDSPEDYKEWPPERYQAFVKKCQYFFSKDYMPDWEIKDDISPEELYAYIVRLQTYYREDDE